MMDVVLRAEASPDIGIGHAMRLLAVADAVRERGGRAVLIASEQSSPWLDPVRRGGLGVVLFAGDPGGDMDVATTLNVARSFGVDAAVVDGYEFPPEYYVRLRRRGLTVAAIDDIPNRLLPVNLLCSPCVGAERLQFRTPDYCVRLQGSRYALLRAEVRAHGHADRNGSVRRLLLAFGGSDPRNATAHALANLPAGKNLVVTVVLGPAFCGSHSALARATAHAIGRGYTIELARNPSNMGHLMASADIAVVAAGGTLTELCYLGCPTAAYAVADNQIPGATALQRSGAIVGGGLLDKADIGRDVTRLLASSDTRQRLSRTARNLVDGRGADRMLRVLESLSAQPASRHTTSIAARSGAAQVHRTLSH